MTFMQGTVLLDMKDRGKLNQDEAEIWQKSGGRHHNIKDTAKKVHMLQQTIFIAPKQSLEAK